MALPLAGPFLQFLTAVEALPEHSADSHHRSAAGHLSFGFCRLIHYDPAMQK
jgi:hypothetical protein